VSARDLVLAGTQRIRPAGSHRAQFVAVAISLVLVGAVSGGVLTATLRGAEPPTPPVTVSPTPTTSVAVGGWVTYSSASWEGDIYVVAAGSAPRRVLGTDDDELDQVCPAFSADGQRLASGQAIGSLESGWQDAAVVITDLDRDGAASASTTIPLPGLSRPPCPMWSPDGRWVAFGAETQDAARWGVVDQVWIVATEGGEVRRLTGLSATDVEWAPDGSQLYIADDGGIQVYSVAEDETRALEGIERATSLTVSPDGRMLAVERRRGGAEDHDLVLMDADGSNQRVLVDEYSRLHGLGPVWSPDGGRIVFPRICTAYVGTDGQERTCRDQHDVVIIAVGDDDPMGPLGTQRVIERVQTAEGDTPRSWFPSAVSWSPDGEFLLYLAWEEIDSASNARGAGAGLITVAVDGSIPPAILWETPEGIGAVTAFPRNDFQSWSAR
jgi:Tol biopolymer transport system component